MHYDWLTTPKMFSCHWPFIELYFSTSTSRLWHRTDRPTPIHAHALVCAMSNLSRDVFIFFNNFSAVVPLLVCEQMQRHLLTKFGLHVTMKCCWPHRIGFFAARWWSNRSENTRFHHEKPTGSAGVCVCVRECVSQHRHTDQFSGTVWWLRRTHIHTCTGIHMVAKRFKSTKHLSPFDASVVFHLIQLHYENRTVSRPSQTK